MLVDELIDFLGNHGRRAAPRERHGRAEMREAEQELAVPPLHIEGEADEGIDGRHQPPERLVVVEYEAYGAIRVFRSIKHGHFALRKRPVHAATRP